jgi:glyoxylase-like metal-dependent hydrolase (beta-lactamase superfamily II)
VLRLLTMLSTILLMCSVTAHANDVLKQALAASGAATIKTIQYSASGATFTVGQNKNPTVPWPRNSLDGATFTIDYESNALKAEALQNKNRVQSFLAGGRAWNIGANNNPVPSPPAAASLRQMQIWLTPHGFLKLAAANKASVRRRKVDGKDVQVVSFTAPNKSRMTGTLNADNLVEKIETVVDNPVLGDMPVEVSFAGYKDYNGVKFPSKLVQRDGGFPSSELDVTDVKANVELRVDVPDAIRSASPPPLRVEAQKIGDGLWYLTGGSHHSLAVEFKDHVVVIEAPLNEERTLAVLGEVRKSIPGKPVRYVVSTHHHFDHSGGVRAAAAEKATIVTHESNKDFYQKVFSTPRTLNPGKYSGKVKGKVVGFSDKHVMTDGERSLELHQIAGSPHHDGILLAYLPKEKILVQADVYSPAAPNAPPPATPNPAAMNLYDNIQRLKLDVAQIAPIHGRIVPLAELERTIGRAK